MEFHGRAWENHQNSVKNKLDTEFKFMDFYNVALLSQYLKKTGVVAGENRDSPWKNMETKLEILKLDNMVMFTKKGLIEYQKPKHEWD